jgi:Zn finger protein HypA/HybF involved in hydrogenase expression
VSGARWVKEIQMANGKGQMVNVEQFEFCYLLFAI